MNEGVNNVAEDLFLISLALAKELLSVNIHQWQDLLNDRSHLNRSLSEKLGSHLVELSAWCWLRGDLGL